MPELPSITVYLERLEALVGEGPLEAVRLRSSFLLRTAVPPLSDAFGRRVVGYRRIGKRIVLGLEGELFLVIHLMIAGRLRWRERGAAIPGRVGLAAFDFPSGSAIFTEASKKKRASLHLVAGEAALADFDRGGIEVLGCSVEELGAALTAESHTLKRALTDQHILSGIGNAYSDEILHRARLSPFKLTSKLEPGELERLHGAIQSVLGEWIERLRQEVGDGFPEKVTAFHPAMAVHGKYRQPCPECGAPIQRIVYADNESNYCAECQNAGKLFADRALSRLLKKNWPRTLEELEDRAETRRR
jgi:formamidopyrimidine-DNA glycosylase